MTAVQERATVPPLPFVRTAARRGEFRPDFDAWAATRSRETAVVVLELAPPAAVSA